MKKHTICSTILVSTEFVTINLSPRDNSLPIQTTRGASVVFPQLVSVQQIVSLR
jgi:hypothetical protein